MKNRVTFLVIVMALLLSCALTVFQVKAQGNTIVVPDNCATVEEAINRARDGDTVLIKKGDYQGPKNQTLIINKTINLVGEDKENTKLHLDPPLVPMSLFTYEYMGYPDALRVEANGTTITNLTIDSPGGNIAINALNTKIADSNITIGITVTSGRSRIVDNTISGTITYNCDYNAILGNFIKGLIQSTSGAYNLIADNTVSATSNLYGISIRGNDTVMFNNTVASNDNGAAIYIEGSSRDNMIAKNNLLNGGLYLSAWTYSNIICANNLNGWGLSLMGFNHVIYANQLAYVGIGGTHGGTEDAANNTFYHNNFVDTSPEFQVYTKQPDLLTLDNGVEGNYWSNYTGDGAAPYEVFAEYHYFDGSVREDANVSLGLDIHPLIAPFNIESVNIQLPAWAEMMLQNLPMPSTNSTPPPSATETATPIVPTNLPTESSAVQQTPVQQPFPWLIFIAAIIAVLIAVSLLLYYRLNHPLRP